MLGFRLRGTRLTVDPCIPRAWPGFTIAFRHRSTTYDIVVENPQGVSRGVSVVEVDGRPVDGSAGIALAADHKPHHIRVVLGPTAPRASSSPAPTAGSGASSAPSTR